MSSAAANPILIVGASGLVGSRLARAFLAQAQPVRCLARDPARVADLAAAGCQVERGDIADIAAVRRAMTGAQAVYVSIHTLSPQPGGGARSRFMDIEARGLSNVIAVARDLGVRRIVYVTSLGISADAPSEWLRERWRTEQMLLQSGLDGTVIRPGHIAGVGGQGFDTVMSLARRRLAISMTGDRPLFRTIALEDLVYYLIAVLDEPGAIGQRFDVGGDDVLSVPQMIDIAADALGRPHPTKIQMPRAVLGALAPLLGRLTNLPRGAAEGFIQALTVDSIGDPAPIRSLLPRQLLSFRESVDRVLAA